MVIFQRKSIVLRCVCNVKCKINYLLSVKQKELEKLTIVTDNLYMDWRMGEITKTEYRTMIDKLEIQVEQLQKTIPNLEKEKEILSKGIDTNKPYLTTFLKITLNEECLLSL